MRRRTREHRSCAAASIRLRCSIPEVITLITAAAPSRARWADSRTGAFTFTVPGSKVKQTDGWKIAHPALNVEEGRGAGGRQELFGKPERDKALRFTDK